jgi:ATP-dependent protease ClpP protease subunit
MLGRLGQVIYWFACVPVPAPMAQGSPMLRELAMLIAGVAALSVELSAAKAADISVDSPGIGKPPVVTIIGEIKPDDSKRFASLVAGLPSAIVGLASPGGNMLASVQIGEIIREKRFTTVVPHEAICASGCALVWLAGVRRYVWETARIGFHGAFNPRTMEGSGPGNAIVGAYLNKLGLSYEAVAYMTAASPTDMRWLHSEDAKRLGIAAGELSNLNLDKPISVENFGTEWKLRSEAVTFVMNFFNQWSVVSEARLISALAINYADNVEYYGAKKTVGNVLADKKKWLQRWPIQNYQVRLESMTTNCVETMLECMATGIVDWAVKSPERSTSAIGSSRFSFYLGKVSPERFVIMRENSVVLTNQSSGGR